MPNIDSLSIQFSTKGTKTAVNNIKDMALAVRSLATNINAIDASNLNAVANSMKQLKNSAPTKDQTSRVTAFGNAISGIAKTFESTDASKMAAFAENMTALKKAAPTKAQSERMGGLNTALGALSGTINQIDGSKLTTFTTGMEVLKKSTPTNKQAERMSAFAVAIKDLSAAIGAANITEFSKDMATLGGAVEAFKKSSVNSIQNAVTAMQNMGQTAQQTATTISNATPKNPGNPTADGSTKNAIQQTQILIDSLDKVQVKTTTIQSVLQRMGLFVPTKQFKNLEEQAEKVRGKYNELREALQRAVNEGDIKAGGTEYSKKMAELDALREKYNELILKQRELAQEGGRFTINPAVANAVEKVKTSFNGLQTLLNGVNSGLKSVTSVADRFVSKLRNMGKSAKTAKKETTSLADAAKKLSNEFFRVSKMLKLMVTRMALRKVIAEVGNGFKSLAIHSDEFNDSVSGMMNASKQLGYSFSALVSPLIERFAPAIIYIINLLIKLTNIIQQVFAALSGKSSYYKAKEFTDDWRKSIEDAGDTAKKTAKEVKKTVLGFDELNQLQDNNKDSSGKTSDIKDMFDTVEIENKWKRLADYIKKLAAKLFNPIKKAWEKVGTFVKNAWKRALNEVLKLGQSVARDFWKVWEQEKTQQIFENILKIIGLIGVVVGTLAKKFRQAWDANDTGLHILENIRDIVLIITKYLLVMAIATAKWAETLDFSPILTKFNEWLESIKPVVDAFMGVISDFYTTVILPLAKWAIEEGGPQLLQVFIDFNNKVKWNELRDHLKELWEHVEPFMETIGEGLIEFIRRVSERLAEFLNSGEFVDFLHSVEEWMDSVTASDVADAIEKIVKFYIGIKIAGMLLGIFTKIVGVVGSLAKGLGVILTALKAIFLVAEFIVGVKIGAWIGSILDPDTYGDYAEHPLSLLKETVIALHDWLVMVTEDIQRLFNDFSIKNLGKLFEEIGGATSWIPGQYGDLGKIFETFGKAFQTLTSNADEAGESISNASDKAVTGFSNMTAAAGETSDATGLVTAGAGNFLDASKQLATETSKVSSQISNAKSDAGDLGKSIDKTSEKMDDMTDKGKSLANSLYYTSDTFRDLSNKIKDTQAASSYYNSLKTNVEKDSKSISSSVNDIDFSNVDKMWEEFTKENGDLFKDLSITVDDSTSDIQSYLDEINFDDINADFSDFSTNTDTSMSDAKKVVDESTKNITDDFDKISKSMTKEKWTFQGVADGFKETFKRAREAIKGEWNQIADKLNGEHTVGTERIKIDLPKFARGGFPEDGMFLANHSELVGRFSNGKTAVANNAQIIDGIANGVYQATVRANAQNNGNNKYISNTIVVDGEVIARTVTKAQERQSMRYSPSII